MAEMQDSSEFALDAKAPLGPTKEDDQLQKDFAQAREPVLERLQVGQAFRAMLPYRREVVVEKVGLTPDGWRAKVAAQVSIANQTTTWHEVWGSVTDEIKIDEQNTIKEVHVRVLETNRPPEDETKSPLKNSIVQVISKIAAPAPKEVTAHAKT